MIVDILMYIEFTVYRSCVFFLIFNFLIRFNLFLKSVQCL